MSQGKFITFEGPDSSGKTTQVLGLADHLTSRGYTVVTTREPGGTSVGDTMRHMLLTEPMGIKTELLLFAAGRSEHLTKVILPALEKGYVVISDRFSDSTYAYQGSGRGMFKEVLELERFVQGSFQPHHTLFFDLPKEEAFRRLQLRRGPQDRLEKESEAFRLAVWEGYQQRFLTHSDRMHRIDALPEPKVVAEQIIRWANSVFENLA